MVKEYLYLQIAASIRQQIVAQELEAGEQIPSVRAMAARWGCTIGTVQRAYETLAEQGLVASRPGQGTRVIATRPAQETEPLRRAALVHRAEAFLLEALTQGYSQSEVEQAVQLAWDRWRTLAEAPAIQEPALRFVGSHDPALVLIATHFIKIEPAHIPDLHFAGSLGGLLALAEGKADLAGIHLWDAESHSYNVPFVRHFFVGRRVALLTLAQRQLGLMSSPGLSAPPADLREVADSAMRFVNRQPGSGTRVWLDVQLQQLGLAPDNLTGYRDEVATHTDVARTIAEGQADVGLGVAAAATAYGLAFKPLAEEQYDLAIPADLWNTPAIQALAHWLPTPEAHTLLSTLNGYNLARTGEVTWVN